MYRNRSHYSLSGISTRGTSVYYCPEWLQRNQSPAVGAASSQVLFVASFSAECPPPLQTDLRADSARGSPHQSETRTLEIHLYHLKTSA